MDDVRGDFLRPPHGESVFNMLCELGWRSLANRRIDARMIMLYKIIHGYVAIELPTYFERPMRYTRHMHPLVYRQIHTAVSNCYYQHSFYPASIVLWDRLLVADLFLYLILKVWSIKFIHLNYS